MKLRTKYLIATALVLTVAAIAYICTAVMLPGEITMYCGQPNYTNLAFGMNISTDMPVMKSQKGVVPLKTGTYDASVSIAGRIKLKQLKIKVSDPKKVYVSGELVGMRIYNKGLIVIKTAAVTSAEGSARSPAEEVGIKSGDIILKINGQPISDASALSDMIKEQHAAITLRRGKSEFTANVKAVKDKTDNRYKIGVWVRDSVAGVGTLTYCDPSTMTFGALGHSVSDNDTSVAFDILHGSLEKSRVVSVLKGKPGSPGEISGAFTGKAVIGEIKKNSEYGVFGTVTNQLPSGRLISVAPSSRVERGKATILCEVDGAVGQYDIEILQTNLFAGPTQAISLKITDKRLLDKTGGIIRGMSGSPIIQHGQLVGAVTHVLVNDPTRGYGIFIEKMMENSF